MLKAWFDDAKKYPLKRKAEDALNNYRRVRGVEPTLLLVWPDALPELEDQFGDVEVRASALLRPNTFYVGKPEDLLT